MKVTINIDMTPAELREAMGLPDVKAIQDKWIAGLEESVAAEIANLSPEALAQRWMNSLVPSQDMLSAFLQMTPGMSKK
jgi:hypothetical protein